MRRRKPEAAYKASTATAIPKFILIVALVLICITAPSVRPAQANTPADWVVIKYHNKHNLYMDSGNWFAIDIRGHATGTEPVVLGYGIAQPEWNIAWVYPVRIGWGETSATLVADGVGVKVGILPKPDGQFAARIQMSPPIGNPAVIVFVANGVLDHAVDNVLPGAVRRYGSGSTALGLDHLMGDAAVAAGPAGAGAGRGEVVATSGIVGGIESRSCAMCAGTWRSPDGTSRTWAQARTYTGLVWGVTDQPGVGPKSFAGPAGPWMWSWVHLGHIDPRYAALQVVNERGTAVLSGSPVVAAWAPIGDDWKLWETANGTEVIPPLQ